MFSRQDEQYMHLALAQAYNALRQGWVPVGAVFIEGSHVIAYGTKDGTKHPRFDHAEHNGCYQALWAGRDGPRDLRGVTVYSTMEPCVMCMSMLMTTRVERIVYAMEDPYGGGAYLLTSPDRPTRFKEDIPMLEGGCLREESKVILREFFTQQSESSNWSDQANPLVVACLA